MAKQAAVEAKQEGEFTLKGKNIPKRKVKDLGKTSKEPVKMEIKKPVEEKVETPKIDLTKKEDNAVQERKTEEIPVGDKPETSREVDKEVRVSDTNDKEDSPLQVIEEITEEVKPKEQVKEKPQLIETPKLPENVEKLVLLHCVSSYPCKPENINFPKMEELKKITKNVGYSGHFEGIKLIVGLSVICLPIENCDPT